MKKNMVLVRKRKKGKKSVGWGGGGGEYKNIMSKFFFSSATVQLLNLYSKSLKTCLERVANSTEVINTQSVTDNLK